MKLFHLSWIIYVKPKLFHFSYELKFFKLAKELLASQPVFVVHTFRCIAISRDEFNKPTISEGATALNSLYVDYFTI